MKLYRVIFIISMISLLFGIFWGVSVAGKAYNQMMQAQKVPPVIEFRNSNIGYHISFMGNNMGKYPAIKNPIPPEKAKVLVDRISNVSQNNKVMDRVIVETERNLYKLWGKSYWSKGDNHYFQKVNEIKVTSIKFGSDIKEKMRRLLKKVLPKEIK